MQWESIDRMVIGSIYHRLAKKRGWVHRLIHDERRVRVDRLPRRDRSGKTVG